MRRLAQAVVVVTIPLLLALALLEARRMHDETLRVASNPPSYVLHVHTPGEQSREYPISPVSNLAPKGSALAEVIGTGDPGAPWTKDIWFAVIVLFLGISLGFALATICARKHLRNGDSARVH